MLDEQISPMLACLSDPFDSPRYIFEINWDGSRCILFVRRKYSQAEGIDKTLIGRIFSGKSQERQVGQARFEIQAPGLQEVVA